MKKSISILLSFLTLISVFSICITTIAQEKQQNNVISVSEEVSELVQQYDTVLLNKEENSDNSITREVKTSRLIVKTKEQIDLFDAIKCVKGLGFYFVQFEDYNSAKAAYDSYKSKGYIVEFDSIIKNNFDEVSSSEETDDIMWAYERVGVDSALKYLSNKNLNCVTVAILDTGVDYTHELLLDRITRNDLNFSSSGVENNCMDVYGHGTSVAGIIALSTPNNVKIEPYRIGEDNGDLLFSSLYCAFEYLLNNNSSHPNILNMSFNTNSTEHEVLDYYFKKLYEANYTVIASAGNENSFAKNWIPSCYNNVLTVSSSDINNKKSQFSNFGEVVDVAAPGENVYTSQIGGEYTNTFSGTSAATPLVTGAAAILMSVNNQLTNTAVYEKIKSTATDVQTSNFSSWCGNGIVNFEKLTGQPLTEAEVGFNIDKGNYYDDTLYIELSTSNPNSTIIYSTDLTIPNIDNGIIYKNPIEISEYTCILAVAIEENKLPGKYYINEYNIIYHAKEKDFNIEPDGTISSYNGSNTSIVVPDVINGIIPTCLGDNLFENNSNIKHIELPDSIKKIGLSAFSNSSIQSITGNGVTNICSFAFDGASQLYYENFPNVEVVDALAFADCINLTKQLSFEKNLQRIDEYVFVNVPVEKISFPKITKSVTRSFVGCLAVEINLPNVTSFQESFNSCYYLTKLYAPNVIRIGLNSFFDCYSLERFDFSNIEIVSKRGLYASHFKEINLDNCTSVAEEAFGDCRAETISLPKITQIPSGCFYQCRNLIKLEIPNVIHFDDSTIIFSNIYSLKQLIIPNADNFPIIHIYAYEDGPWWTEPLQELELEVIYAPKVREIPNMTTSEHDAEDNVTSRPLAEILNSVKWAFFPSLTNENNLPCSKDMNLYLSDSFNYSDCVSQLSELNYTVLAPLGSNAETWSKKNDYAFIDTNSMTNALGGSIRLSDSGLRFGFSWDNITELESFADGVEYGFLYEYGEAMELNRKKVATNRIDHDGYTTFNLVFTNIPKANYDTKISARAYVCIDGMYFYSDIITRSFEGVANAVIADDTIDDATKEQVRSILEA